MTMMYQENFEAILQPFETQIDIEAFLLTTNNIFTPNYCGDYYFEFQPSTTSDIQRLAEMGEKALRECQMFRSPYSPEPQPFWEKKDGTYFVQQPKSFSAIKHNLDDERRIEMIREVGLRLHFHDSPDGKIYLSCDYLNAYYQTEEQFWEEHRQRMAESKCDDDDIDW